MTITYTAPATTLGTLTVAGTVTDFVRPGLLKRTFQVTMPAGATSCSVDIEGSNDGDGWVQMATIDVTVADNRSSGVVTDSPWRDVRARLTAIAGASALITMGT